MVIYLSNFLLCKIVSTIYHYEIRKISNKFAAKILFFGGFCSPYKVLFSFLPFFFCCQKSLSNTFNFHFIYFLILFKLALASCQNLNWDRCKAKNVATYFGDTLEPLELLNTIFLSVECFIVRILIKILAI